MENRSSGSWILIGFIAIFCGGFVAEAATKCRCTGTVRTEGGKRDVYFHSNCNSGTGTTEFEKSGARCTVPASTQAYYWEPAILLSIPFLRSGNGLLNGRCFSVGGVYNKPVYRCSEVEGSASLDNKSDRRTAKVSEDGMSLFTACARSAIQDADPTDSLVRSAVNRNQSGFMKFVSQCCANPGDTNTSIGLSDDRKERAEEECLGLVEDAREGETHGLFNSGASH